MAGNELTTTGVEPSAWVPRGFDSWRGGTRKDSSPKPCAGIQRSLSSMAFRWKTSSSSNGSCRPDSIAGGSTASASPLTTAGSRNGGPQPRRTSCPSESKSKEPLLLGPRLQQPIERESSGYWGQTLGTC